MMNNYEELKLTVVLFEQDDIVTMSQDDNIGGDPGWDQ